MAYLIRSDYAKSIQSDNLNQVINSDDTILQAAERMAVAESKSYLVQKYITDTEFSDTNVYNAATTYKGKGRVYLDASAYSASASYVPGDLTLYLGNVYKCIASTSGAFNATKWALLGADGAMFYAKLPYDEFNYQRAYLKGDHVWYNNNIYVCQIPTSAISHETVLNALTYVNIPFRNVFPDDPINGVAYWGVPTAYSVPAGTVTTNTTYWTPGDNRNQQMIGYVIDICLYHVHSRISPRNIPDLRVKRYDDAVNWLKMAGQGAITADLPLIQPRQGRRINYGGNTKATNTY